MADDVEKLDQRLRVMEITVARAEGAVSLAKWGFGLSISFLLVGIGSAVWTVVIYPERFQQQQKDIARLEKQVDQLNDRLNRISFPASMRPYEGRIVSVSEKQITIETDGQKQTFSLLQSEILVNGKRAKVADLRTGMRVQLYEGPPGEAIRIAADNP